MYIHTERIYSRTDPSLDRVTTKSWRLMTIGSAWTVELSISSVAILRIRTV